MSAPSFAVGEPVIVSGVYNGTIVGINSGTKEILVKFDGWRGEPYWYPESKITCIYSTAGSRSTRRSSQGAIYKADPVADTRPRREHVPPSRYVEPTAADHGREDDSSPDIVQVKRQSGVKRKRRSKVQHLKKGKNFQNEEQSPSPPPASDEDAHPAQEQAIASPVKDIPTATADVRYNTPAAISKLSQEDRRSEAFGRTQSQEFAQLIDDVRNDAAAPAAQTLHYYQSSSVQLANGDERSTAVTRDEFSVSLSASKSTKAGYHPRSLHYVASATQSEIRLTPPTVQPLNPSLSDVDISLMVWSAFSVADPTTRHRIVQSLLAAPHPLLCLQGACTPAGTTGALHFRKLEARPSRAAYAYLAHRLQYMSGLLSPPGSHTVRVAHCNEWIETPPQPLCSVLAVTVIRAIIEMGETSALYHVAALLLSFIPRLFPIEHGCGVDDKIRTSGPDAELHIAYTESATEFLYSTVCSMAWTAAGVSTNADAAERKIAEFFDDCLEKWDAPSQHEAVPKVSPADKTAAAITLDSATSLDPRVQASIGPGVSILQSLLATPGFLESTYPGTHGAKADTLDSALLCLLSCRSSHSEEDTTWRPFGALMLREAQSDILSEVRAAFTDPAGFHIVMMRKLQALWADCRRCSQKWIEAYQALIEKCVEPCLLRPFAGVV